jgi:acetylornithine deacetylase/succinyl-diaminopimelate desuccinylase-like protein
MTEITVAAVRPVWPWARALDAALETRREELFGLTERLIAFETPCPPGRNTAPIQEFLAGRLRALGAEVRTIPLYPGDPQLVAHLAGPLGSTGRSLLLNGHVDVASTAPDEPWTSPPLACPPGRPYLRPRGDRHEGRHRRRAGGPRDRRRDARPASR